MGFDKDKFLAANKNVSGDGLYPEIEPGFYIATLENVNFNNAKSSGRYQISFTWEFDENDPKLAGKKLGVHIGLDKDSGYDALNGCLYAMGVTQSQLVGEFADNPDSFVERLIGTKARLHVTKDGDFTNTRVKKLINSPLKTNGDLVSSPALQTPNQVTNTQTSAPAPTKEVTISVGMSVLVNKNGVQIPGKIMGYQEATNEVLVKPDDPSLKTEPFSLELVIPNPNASQPSTPEKVEDVIEDVVEEVKEPPKMEVGMQATGKYQDQDISGVIHAIEGDIVKIKVAVDGKFKAYPCKKETVVVDIPF